MRNFIIIILGLLTFSATSNAQCSKKVIWTASKAEFLDSNQNITKTLDEKVVVISSKTEMKLTHSDKEDDALTGTVKDFSCNWKDAFKNGKTVIKADLSEPNGEIKNCVINIDAKDGKIIIMLDVNDADGKKIRIFVDSYKEVD
jgi:hypothetical protein